MNPLGANAWIWVSPLTNERLEALAATSGWDVATTSPNPHTGTRPHPSSVDGKNFQYPIMSPTVSADHRCSVASPPGTCLS